MKQDTFNEHVTAADIGTDISVATPRLTLFPYFDILGKTASLCSAFLVRVTDGGNEHTVGVAYLVKDGEPDYFIWCGDKFVEGRNMDEAEARQRCEEAVGSLPGKAKMVTEMLKSFKIFSDSDRCNFWSVWRKDKQLCRHTKAVLAYLRDNQPDFRQSLSQTYDNATTGVTAGPAQGETMDLPELAFRVPVLFEGERGAGKTVTARAFARTNGYKRVEFGGHEGIESPDMLGYLVPRDKGSMVWKDGPISEAFRAAQKQKTVLIIDELLRIRQRELSILLTALSPDEGVYRLRTGRIVGEDDGVASEEELECPLENLCVVATTNVGSEYAVDEIDPALAERFVILRKDTTPAELKRILTEVAKRNKLPTSVVTKCVTFFSKMTEARSRGLVKHAPTTRTLARALELARDEDDVKRGIKTQILLWVARNTEGQPVPEQVTDTEKLIDRCFGSSK